MKEIYRVRYRVGKERSQEIIAIEKICKKRIEQLKVEHGDNVKFSKIVPACDYPAGAPHV